MSRPLTDLDSYDWREAFKYADSPISTVTRIIAMSEGENDAEPWLLVCERTSGDFMFLSAWCDYTGWG